MNLVTFFKASVAIMSVLLILGLALIAYKISDKNFQSKLKTNNNSSIMLISSDLTQPKNKTIISKSEKYLNSDESIFSVQTCGQNLCLITQNNIDNYRLIVINPQSGVLVNTLLLK